MAETPIGRLLDMDGDGALTLDDARAILTRLPDWAAQAYFYPGDSLISFLLKYDATLGLALAISQKLDCRNVVLALESGLFSNNPATPVEVEPSFFHRHSRLPATQVWAASLT